MSPHRCSRPTLVPCASLRMRGFSLIELLAVIAILGIVAAIMLPMIHRYSEGADAARNRRNAQSIATTYMAGQTAGARFLVPGNLDNTIRNVVAGAVIEDGVFAGNVFSVPGLSDADQDEAARYLVLEGDRVTYNPNL